MPQPDFLRELHNVGVAREPVVIALFKPRAAHVERGRLSAQKRRALIHRRAMPVQPQLIRRRKPRRARAYYSHPHIFTLRLLSESIA